MTQPTPKPLTPATTKGLSYLQDKILAAAIERRGLDTVATRRGCDLLTRDAIALLPNGSNRRSAQASLCRMFASLKRRGLVDLVRGKRWSGIKLTESALLTLCGNP